MSSLKVLFGCRLRQLREKRSMSQEKLAEAADVVPRYINYLEHGKRWPSSEKLEKLAQALNIQVKDLFDFTDL